jgi:hypothetical protein
MSESVVIRCSPKNGRVAFLVVMLGLCAVGDVVVGIGNVAARGAGQVGPVAADLAVFALALVGYLRCMEIVVDADYARSHLHDRAHGRSAGGDRRDQRPRRS